MRSPAWIHLLSIGLIGIGAVEIRAADDPAKVERFEKEVRPILVQRCQGCHGAEKQKGGLRLDSRASALAGGGTAPAVVPGDLEASLLVAAVNYGEDLQMPPKSKLPAAEIAALTRWIKEGAVWPGGPVGATKPAAGFNLAERAKHWSFQPLKVVEPPAVRSDDRVRMPIDRFLLRDLEAKGLSFSPEADRATLLRRLSFDLIGLPPTLAELDAFEKDDRPDAYERQVERLLGSEHYGERWGRHWLDLVRFAETAGHEFDYDIPDTWRYRDYVVRAFNDDVPYDKLVVEHVAGDLLAEPRRNPADQSNESIQGTGFFLLGEGTHSPVDVREEQQRRTDNQIEVLSKAFLGLTVACTRCHDHKFDPMTQKDYYALVGVIESSRHAYASIDDPAPRLAAIEEIRRLKKGPLKFDRAGFKTALKTVDRTNRTPDAKPGATWDLFESFDHDLGGWMPWGEAFGATSSVPGDRRLVGDRLVAVPAGRADSSLVSEKLSGVLRSPTFRIERPFIQVLVSGRHADINIVVDGFEKIRNPIYGGLKQSIDHGDEPRWAVFDVGMWRGHDAYIELADGGFADFSGGKTVVPPGDGYIAVDEVRFADSPTPEGPDSNRFPPDFLAAKGESPDAWVERIADVVEAGCSDGSAGALIAWTSRRGFLASQDAEVAKAIQAAEAKLPPPRLVPAVTDGDGKDAALLIRGQAKTPSAAVPRRFLEVIGGGPSLVSGPGSGRAELAKRIADRSNPLFGRVMANRIWKGHFGEGIVRSTDDFGVMGELPSHPELLDWLADRFAAEGWSIKAMHRLIVNSSAYRQTSRLADAKIETADPNNRLLHRANVRRLEAEALRDAILSVAGELDPRLGGPGVAPHLTPFMEGRGRPGTSGPLDGDRRRSIYLNVRRNFLSPLLLVFDYPTPATTIGRRNVSNVPAQALALLNDPFILEEARRWADRERIKGGTDAERLARVYRTSIGRLPADSEKAVALAFLKEVAAESGEASAWSQLCHSLINSKAFLFVE